MEKLNILVIGGTGFIGTTLCKSLFDKGYKVTALSRQSASDNFEKRNIGFIQDDVALPGKWQELISEYDVVINLTGASIFRRWTNRGKQQILDSRIVTTRNIVDSLIKNGGKIQQFFSVSGVGYYGHHGEKALNEDDPAGTDFLAQVAAQWEEIAMQVGEFGIRPVICRFGHVLGRRGGVLPKLTTLAKWHLASHWGSGNQWISWIHEADLARCIMFLIDNPEIIGPVNVTSPNPVRNREFMNLLSKTIDKIVLFPPIPEFVLQLITGEFASVFVNGQRVIPGKLIRRGFKFDYPDLRGALDVLLSSYNKF